MNDIVQFIETSLGVKVNVGAFMVTSFAMNWLGTRVKKMPRVPDELIPAVLALVGMLIYVALSISLGTYSNASWAVGIVAGGFSVGMNQGFRQTKSLVVGPPTASTDKPQSPQNNADSIP